MKILGCKIQDISTSILILDKFEEMSEEDGDDESDKHTVLIFCPKTMHISEFGKNSDS